MSTCSRCRFQQLLPSYNFCPECGTPKKRRKTLRVVKTDEPLTEEDWGKILNLKWGTWFKGILEELKEHENAPVELREGRCEWVNRDFIIMNLPYRFTHIGRHHKSQDFQYLYKLFKVRPKNMSD